MKKPKWQIKLKKSEINHIKETTDSSTLVQFKRNREFHNKAKEKDGHEPCFDCRMIAQKIGIET